MSDYLITEHNGIHTLQRGQLFLAQSDRASDLHRIRAALEDRDWKPRKPFAVKYNRETHSIEDTP